MSKIFKMLMVVLVVGLMFCGNSFAARIDFNDSVFSGCKDQVNCTRTVDGIDLTFEALSSTGSPKLWWDNVDGFGVSGVGYEGDEVENPEVLSITFDAPQFVENFYLTDFFYEKEGSHWYQERGSYSLDGGSTWVGFMQTDLSQTQANGNGLFTLAIGSLVDEVLFTAPGRLSTPCWTEGHEISVLAVDVAPVPEPATMLLLGSGLIGLAGFGRKKFIK